MQVQEAQIYQDKLDENNESFAATFDPPIGPSGPRPRTGIVRSVKTGVRILDRWVSRKLGCRQADEMNMKGLLKSLDDQTVEYAKPASGEGSSFRFTDIPCRDSPILIASRNNIVLRLQLGL